MTSVNSESSNKMSSRGAVVMEGMLQKRGAYNKDYKSRHFRLYGRSLAYFKTEKTTKALGDIPLEGTYLLNDSKSAGFKILTTARTYYIKALDQNLAQKWIVALANSTGVSVDDEINAFRTGEAKSLEDAHLKCDAQRAKFLLKYGQTDTKAGESPATKILLSGFLLKRGAFNKSYNKRFFQLTEKSFTYFKTEKAKKSKGKIDIEGATLVTEKIVNEGNLGFKIISPSEARTYYLKAESEKDYRVWIKAMILCPDLTLDRSSALIRYTEDGGRSEAQVRDPAVAGGLISHSVGSATPQINSFPENVVDNPVSPRNLTATGNDKEEVESSEGNKNTKEVNGTGEDADDGNDAEDEGYVVEVKGHPFGIRVQDMDIIRVQGLAKKAGIKVGDRIAVIAGQLVENVDQLTELFTQSEVPFKMRLWRPKDGLKEEDHSRKASILEDISDKQTGSKKHAEDSSAAVEGKASIPSMIENEKSEELGTDQPITEKSRKNSTEIKSDKNKNDYADENGVESKDSSNLPLEAERKMPEEVDQAGKEGGEMPEEVDQAGKEGGMSPNDKEKVKEVNEDVPKKVNQADKEKEKGAEDNNKEEIKDINKDKPEEIDQADKEGKNKNDQKEEQKGSPNRKTEGISDLDEQQTSKEKDQEASNKLDGVVDKNREIQPGGKKESVDSQASKNVTQQEMDIELKGKANTELKQTAESDNTEQGKMSNMKETEKGVKDDDGGKKTSQHVIKEDNKPKLKKLNEEEQAQVAATPNSCCIVS